MLTAIDTAALNNSGLRPDARSSIGQSLALRTVIVQTATYASYTAPYDGPLMSYTAPAGTLSPGNTFRIRMFGTVNGDHGPNTFLFAVRTSQSSASDAIGAIWQVNDGLTAWEVDGVLTFSAPNTSNPGTASRTIIGPSDPLVTNCPILVTGGMLRLFLTDATATGGTVAGGVIATAPGDTTQSYLISTVDPSANLQVIAGQPLGISMSVISDADFTVQGGWMEAM